MIVEAPSSLFEDTIFEILLITALITPFASTPGCEKKFLSSADKKALIMFFGIELKGTNLTGSVSGKPFKKNPFIKRDDLKSFYLPFLGVCEVINKPFSNYFEKNYDNLKKRKVTKKKNNMDFYEWSFKDLLMVSNKGIPEPVTKHKEVYPDVLIVPLVGFDNNKFRLGYGGGFYDRYISKIKKIKRVITVGFAFSFQKTFKIPINKFDQKLDIILTNKSIEK